MASTPYGSLRGKVRAFIGLKQHHVSMRELAEEFGDDIKPTVHAMVQAGALVQATNPLKTQMRFYHLPPPKPQRVKCAACKGHGKVWSTP